MQNKSLCKLGEAGLQRIDLSKSESHHSKYTMKHHQGSLNQQNKCVTFLISLCKSMKLHGC